MIEVQRAGTRTRQIILHNIYIGVPMNYLTISNKNYASLCSAVRERNESAIATFTNTLTVPSIFTTDILTKHYDRLNIRLYGVHGLVYELSSKKQAFEKPSERNCNRGASTLKTLHCDIINLSEDVRIISRILHIITKELNNRDQLVSVMKEERNNVSSTAVGTTR
jgi:hypothetical protein